MRGDARPYQSPTWLRLRGHARPYHLEESEAEPVKAALSSMNQMYKEELSQTVSQADAWMVLEAKLDKAELAGKHICVSLPTSVGASCLPGFCYGPRPSAEILRACIHIIIGTPRGIE